MKTIFPTYSNLSRKITFAISVVMVFSLLGILGLMTSEVFDDGTTHKEFSNYKDTPLNDGIKTWLPVFFRRRPMI